MIDLHSHLLPGVDDGARTFAEGIEALQRMRAAGITVVAATPHVDASELADPVRSVDRLAELDRAWEGWLGEAVPAVPGIRIVRGAEVKLDDPDPVLDDSRIRIDGGARVLVEWPGMRVPPNTSGVLGRIAAKGLRPILAHPERYHANAPILDLARVWREAGAVLQVNLASLVGGYGAEARERGWALVHAGQADLLASDHHARPGLPLPVGEVRERFARLGPDGEEAWRILTEVNPSCILSGSGLEPLPLLGDRRGVGRGLLGKWIGRGRR